MRRIVCVLALAATIATAPAAQADEPVSDPEIASYLVLAHDFWKAEPTCPGPVAVVHAEWVPAGAWGAAYLGGCTIGLSAAAYPWRPELGLRNWWSAAMCSVMAHEYGHVLGHEHSTDPADVMNPVVPLNIVPGCPTYVVAPDPSPAPAPAPPVAGPTPQTKDVPRYVSPRQRWRAQLRLVLKKGRLNVRARLLPRGPVADRLRGAR